MREPPQEVKSGILLAWITIIIFRALTEALYLIQTWNTGFLRRLWRTGLNAARRTDPGTFFVSQKRLHEVVRGPHAFLPTPPSHLLLFKSVKKQNLRQGRGTDICRVNREGDLWGRVQHCCLIPYRPPSGGGTIKNSLKRTRRRK